jgi:hypothetical protein
MEPIEGGMSNTKRVEMVGGRMDGHTMQLQGKRVDFARGDCRLDRYERRGETTLFDFKGTFTVDELTYD